MNTKYVDLFVEYLQKDCGYRERNLRTNIYKYDGKEYGRVEVLSDGYVIQAFVLMSAEHCRSLDKFPFYRTYSQWNDCGRLTPPACNVVVYVSGKDDWEIHSSSDLRHEITDLEFLNFEKAKDRFQKRLYFIGNEKLTKAVRIMSIISLSSVALYVCAHILSLNGFFRDVTIPLNSEILSILILIVILILLPPLVPYIKIKWNGISLEVNQE